MSNRPVFHKDRHIRYWLRCLKTFLPTDYTSNDSNRMTLGFFILAALDLLDALPSKATADEQTSYAAWIYHCQHPDGGFRGSPASDMGIHRTGLNRVWDPANLPATCFALTILLVLGDDFSRLRRPECLAWLSKLQRSDGSFGEFLGDENSIQGGKDPRLSLFAATIRFILRGRQQSALRREDDIDVDALVRHLNQSESYEHGIAEAPFQEAHAGYTYCAIGALSLLDRLPAEISSDPQSPSSAASRKPDAQTKLTGLTSLEETLHWLVSRQIPERDEDDDDDEDEHRPTNGVVNETTPMSKVADTSISLDPGNFRCAGFNGRTNKYADTCYSFWVGGSLKILGHISLLDFDANYSFLLEQTQHQIGGFGRYPGSVPDVLHSYLGLAALALMGDPGVEKLDPTLCISMRARNHLFTLPWWRTVNAGESTE